jgi:hypothetical protein
MDLGKVCVCVRVICMCACTMYVCNDAVHELCEHCDFLPCECGKTCMYAICVCDGRKMRGMHACI